MSYHFCRHCLPIECCFTPHLATGWEDGRDLISMMDLLSCRLTGDTIYGRNRMSHRTANQTLDRMTRSAASRMFQIERPWRAPRHRSALRSAKNCNFSYGCRVSYEGMIHFRIIGSIWLVSCLVPAVKLAFDLCSLATQRPNGPLTDDHGAQFWITQLLVEVSFLLIMLIGWGLIRLRRWAAVAGRFWGVVSLLVCVWFILTQGMQHGPV